MHLALPDTYRLVIGRDFVRVSERRTSVRRGLRSLFALAGLGLLVRYAGPYLATAPMEAPLVGGLLACTLAGYLLAALAFNARTVEFTDAHLGAWHGPFPWPGSGRMPLSEVSLFTYGYELVRNNSDGGGTMPQTLGELRRRPFRGFFSGVRVIWTVYVVSRSGDRDVLFDDILSEEEAESLRDCLQHLLSRDPDPLRQAHHGGAD